MTQNLSTLKIPITKQLTFVSNVLFAWASLLINWTLSELKGVERNEKRGPSKQNIRSLSTPLSSLSVQLSRKNTIQHWVEYSFWEIFFLFFNLLSDPFSTLFSFQLVKSQIFQIWLTTCNPEMRSRPLMLLDIYNIYVTVKNMWRIKSGIAHSFAIFSNIELTIL